MHLDWCDFAHDDLLTLTIPMQHELTLWCTHVRSEPCAYAWNHRVSPELTSLNPKFTFTVHTCTAPMKSSESTERKKVRLVRLDSLNLVYVTLFFSYISRSIVSACSTILIVCTDYIFILWVWGSVLAEIWHNPISVHCLKRYDAR